MPSNKKEKALFAFLTVLITVHAYVFYSLYVVNGSTLMNLSGTTSVIKAINTMGGVYMMGNYFPIWALVLIELLFAFVCEMLVGSPLSFKIVSKKIDFKKSNPDHIENEIIKTTIIIMVPLMSLIAAILYFPYYAGFNIFTLLANWLKLVCLNFPFAYFTQIFLIQPCVRFTFKKLLKK